MFCMSTMLHQPADAETEGIITQTPAIRGLPGMECGGEIHGFVFIECCLSGIRMIAVSLMEKKAVNSTPTLAPEQLHPVDIVILYWWEETNTAGKHIFEEKGHFSWLHRAH